MLLHPVWLLGQLEERPAGGRQAGTRSTPLGCRVPAAAQAGIRDHQAHLAGPGRTFAVPGAQADRQVLGDFARVVV